LSDNIILYFSFEIIAKIHYTSSYQGKEK